MSPYFTCEQGALYQGDCLEVMKQFPEGSIDLVLTDPPYGTTACKWDSVVPFEPMWIRLHHLLKKNRAIVLFGSEPFSSALRMSNIKNYKYDWMWRKNKVGGFTSAKLKPLKIFENVCVFSEGKTANCNKNNMSYFPQGLIEVNKRARSSTDSSPTGYARPSQTREYIQQFTGYPKQELCFDMCLKRMHPTQKPVALMEYLIKTYTLEGETVLDFTIGSGTTAVACVNTNRSEERRVGKECRS